MRKYKLGSFGFASAIALVFALTQGVEATTFSNPGAITINDNSAATPYPSNIIVSGVTGAVTDVNVTISGISHTFPDDIDILLVGPSGQTILLMSDVGGALDVTGITLTLDDAALSALPDGSPLVSGTFMPTNFDGNDGVNDIFPGPAPAGPYGSLLSAFNGIDANGTWSLFVRDDEGVDIGSIANGWSLEIVTAVPEPGSLMLLSLGFAGLAARRFKKQN